jgi:ABC-type multidrug transport system ATPase subunit
LHDKRESGFGLPIHKHLIVKEILNRLFSDFSALDKERNFIFNIFTIEFSGLSSGEKSLLSMFGRFGEAAAIVQESQTDVLLLLDEPEVALHPQWQTAFIDLLNDNLPVIFPKKNIQLIITSHSPIIISDLPKTNVVFLKKDVETGQCEILDLVDMDNTFAANIHSLYANAFFLKNKGGSMGKLAKKVITEIAHQLSNSDQIIVPTEDISYIKEVINSVGEPLVKERLNEMLFSKFPEQQYKNLDAKVEYLRQALAQAEQAQNRNNENNR